MRLRSLSFRGITRFQSATPVTIDFEALGEGLIALVGENGAGKTTAMEAVPVALFKAFPTRPGFYENFSGRDAFIEAVFDDAGAELKVRLQVDAERRQTEGYLFEDGRSLTTGRAAEFDSEVSRRFGSVALFLSSVFASQSKAGAFLGLKKTDRKSLFIELLGLGSLEVMAGAAREKRAEWERQLAVERQRVTDAEAELAGMPRAEIDLEDRQRQADLMAGEVEKARVEEAAAAAALERAKQAGERIASLRAADESATAALRAADKAVKDADALAEAARKRARERREFIQRGRPDQLEAAARQRHTSALARLSARRVTLERQLADVPDAVAARQELARVKELRAEYHAIDERVAQALQEKTEAASAVRQAEAVLELLRDAQRKRRIRLERQAGLLPTVPCNATDDWARPARGAEALLARSVGGIDLAGACPLLADARTAQGELDALRSGEGPEIADAEAELASKRAAFQRLDAAYGDAQQGADLARVDLDFTEREALKDIARAEAATTAKAQLEQVAAETAEADATLERELAEAAEALKKATADLADVEEQLTADLMEAEARQAEADTALGEAEAHRVTTQVALEEAISGVRDPAAADADRVIARRQVKGAEFSLREAYLARAKAQATVDALRDRASSLEGLRQRVAGAESELGQWSLLDRGLGKDGAQALLVDAAGPEVAALTNELLEACYGPRFSIAFETLREKKSAKGEYSESFDVKVFDGGIERAAEALAGGEKVVVGEAIGLAIAILNARKSGIRWETLWRDETAGALDPDNAQAYVLMLRRARELGAFSQVLFVSHSPEVWEAADVRLVVAGGRVAVEKEAVAA